MKKLIFIFLLIFAVSIVFGQEEEKIPTEPKELYTACMENYFLYQSEAKEKAFKYALGAHEKGYIPGSMRYGICLFFGEGVKKDQEKAIKIIDEVFPKLEEIAKEDINAQYELGNAYIMGIGTSVKKFEGYRYMMQAAQKGSVIAMETVAKCLMRGIGCEKSVPDAINWFEKAFEKGSVASEYQLALFYINGVGVQKNHKKAMDMLFDADKKGNFDATLSLGIIYLNGQGETLDEVKAVEYFTKASKGENPRAMYYLGNCLIEGMGVEKDVEKGLLWIMKSASMGDELAVNMMTDYKDKPEEMDL